MNAADQEKTMVHYRTCPLCEATCGLEIHTKGAEVVQIKGDKEDPFSKGYLCPKGYSLDKLYADPDRITKPMIREGEKWREVSWSEAFQEVKRGLRSIIETDGRDAVATYLGNPNVHNLAGMLYMPLFMRALNSKNRYSASTMDQIPKQLTAELMFGSDFTIPIPDIDRTDYFLVLGANPLVSNGSLMTAPNMRKRLKELQKRGGKMVVIDPVKTVTAKVADEHHFITPGTDAFFLMGLLNTVFAQKLEKVNLEHLNGLDEVRKAVEPFTPEVVAAKCGLDARTIRRLAHELANAKKAIVYGRMGTSTQVYGTLNSWLIDVLNTVTGNLDSEGGVMFTSPAAGSKQGGKRRKEARLGRFHSRVRKLPEVLGELPISCLAEEIQTEGKGQIKALVTIAGNPVLSAPNGTKMSEAISQLDFMVSVDCYLNETTKHANVLLPAPSSLERSHYDLSFYQLSVRNIAHYSKKVFELPEGQLDEWEVLLHLTAAVSDQEVGEDPVSLLDDLAIKQLIKKECQKEGSPLADRNPKEIYQQLAQRRGPERMLDFLIRTGEYGDFFGRNSNGITLKKLEEEHPHGLDLGPLKPRIPQILTTPSGKVELAPKMLLEDVERLKADLAPTEKRMMLVSRRHLQSNNSWMHNIQELTKGGNRCTLQIHPTDAARYHLESGQLAEVKSEAGMIEVAVDVTDDVMEGVVSLPHGWGHHVTGIQLRNGQKHPGVNSNRLSDEKRVDPVSGNAVFNGIPVAVRASQ